MGGAPKDFNPKDIVGNKYNRLTVVSLHHTIKKYGDNIYYYKCQCECGNTIILPRNVVKNGYTKSCGCLIKEKLLERTIKHNMSGTRFYRIWNHMKRRCKNPNSNAYEYYGGRGITYDPRWEYFENFRDDMYEDYCKRAIEEGGEQYISIDRKDVNGNYCKENCRWATNKVQQNNKRNTIYYNYKNSKLTSREIYDKYSSNNLKFKTFLNRLESGMPVEDAIKDDKITHEKVYEYKNKYYTVNDLLSISESGVNKPMLYTRLRKSNKYVTSYGLIHNDDLFKFKSSHEHSTLTFPVKIVDENRRNEIVNEAREQIKNIKFN